MSRAGAARRRPRARRVRARARRAARAAAAPGGCPISCASAGSAPRARAPRARPARAGSVVEGDAGPLPARRERHLERDVPRRAAARCACSASAVGLRAPRLAANAPSQRVHVALAGAGERHDLLDRERAVGERAGLVEADDVDAGQRLDRVQALDERAAAADARGGDREDEARQQHEALGHERDDARGGRRDGLAQGHVVRAQRVQEQDRDRDHDRHIRRSRRLIESCSGESSRRSSRAASVSSFAYASAPTRSAS